MFTTSQKFLLLNLFVSVSAFHRFRSPHFGGELEHLKKNSFQRLQEETSKVTVEKTQHIFSGLLMKLEESKAKMRDVNREQLALESHPETGSLETGLDSEGGRIQQLEEVTETSRDYEKTMKSRGTHADGTPEVKTREISKEDKRDIPMVDLPEKENSADTKTTEESVFDRSVKETPKTSRTTMTTAVTTQRPTGEPQVSPKLEEIGPDRIIDNPFVSCPIGQNNDSTGRCRPVFP